MRHEIKQGRQVFDAIITHCPDASGEYKYAAEVPILPGCYSDGRTREEAIENIKDAISLYLAALKKRLAKKDVVKVSV